MPETNRKLIDFDQDGHQSNREHHSIEQANKDCLFNIIASQPSNNEIDVKQSQSQIDLELTPRTRKLLSGDFKMQLAEPEQTIKKDLIISVDMSG